MTPAERAAVAMILALPDTPWDFAEGFRTAKEYFDDIQHASEHHTRRWTPPERTKRPIARKGRR